jgi:hypothetical protein|nr:MAG TPA: hypothetical protein [Caudoviricetes sp.]DAJ21604.1 MAG TPA: hypothetical protein [Siphoviridae sp. ctFjF5]DAU57456.1 MAG TPA: hypothetical protein [Caudoviricetes sp.]DAY49119.1 MAG TPA: hypothetical protein [Caudoviricetes sp.]
MEFMFSTKWFFDILFICSAVIWGFLIHALSFHLAYDEEYDTEETKNIVFYIMVCTCFFIPYQAGQIALYLIK